MSELRMTIMAEELSNGSISCGVQSIDDRIKEAYSRTLCKQAVAYNVLVDDCLVGNCMVRLVWLCDETEEYYVTDKEYIALEITYIAIDTRYQRKGIGSCVLKRLMLIAESFSKQLPIRFLIIDALDDKKQWYMNAGFKEYPKREDLRHIGTIPMRVDLIDKSKIDQYVNSQE